MLEVKSKFKKVGKTLYLRIPHEMATDSKFPFLADQDALLQLGAWGAVTGRSVHMGVTPVLMVTGL